jgi:hypothetical protein
MKKVPIVCMLAPQTWVNLGLAWKIMQALGTFLHESFHYPILLGQKSKAHEIANFLKKVQHWLTQSSIQTNKAKFIYGPLTI